MMYNENLGRPRTVSGQAPACETADLYALGKGQCQRLLGSDLLAQDAREAMRVTPYMEPENSKYSKMRGRHTLAKNLQTRERLDKVRSCSGDNLVEVGAICSKMIRYISFGMMGKSLSPARRSGAGKDVRKSVRGKRKGIGELTRPLDD
jgi:hypothetical protein